MNSRFYTQMLGAWIFFSSLNLHAQGFSVVLDTATVQPGQDFCMAVTCKGFENIVSFQFSLNWNAQVLKFKQTKTPDLPGWSETGLNYFISNDHLLLGWSHPTADCLSKIDGDTLFEVCFTAIGAPGVNSLIIAGGSGFPPGNGGAEAYNCFDQDIWTLDEGSDTGLVIINLVSGTWSPIQNKESTFILAPNPTMTSTQVWMEESKPGLTTIRVTDALGRLVFEQKISVQEGINSLEIPKEALSTQGIYMVSQLKENGVTTQLLSVN